LLTEQHTQESLSLAYAHALAGQASVGLRIDRVFDYGVDGSLAQIVVRGTRHIESGFPIDFQLKSTIQWEHDGDHVVYDLEAKTYNDLVTRPPEADRCILILLCLPRTREKWVEETEKEMILRHCCYWMHVVGKETDNAHTKRIRIPRANRLTVTGIQEMMTAERKRRLGA
jgi:Domain of unknown function (DUF4365)